jgi:hypothetical protein
VASGSAKGENSYAHQNDMRLGVALVDRFTDATFEFMHRFVARLTAQPLPRVLAQLQKVRAVVGECDWLHDARGIAFPCVERVEQAPDTCISVLPFYAYFCPCVERSKELSNI